MNCPHFLTYPVKTRCARSSILSLVMKEIRVRLFLIEPLSLKARLGPLLRNSLFQYRTNRMPMTRSAMRWSRRSLCRIQFWYAFTIKRYTFARMHQFLACLIFSS